MVGDDPLVERTKAALPDLIAIARRHLASDDLLHHGSLLAGATVVSGGFNYLFQVFVGRVLGPAQYGVFGALFALFYLVGILGSGIRLSATRFTAECDRSDAALASLHAGLFTRSLVLGLGIGTLLLVGSPAIAGLLGLSTPWPVVLVALTVPATFPIMTNRGAFQGRQWFALLGAYSVFQSGVKLLAGVGLVVLGYGLFGALSAMVVAAVCGLVATTLHLRTRLPAGNGRLWDRQFDYGTVYRYATPAILAGFCLTVPSNVDVIVAKHAFTSEQAGLYTAASVLGKILLFLPMGISGALFPKVTTDNTTAGLDRLHALFDRAMGYTGAVAGAGAVVFWFLPRVILETFFGTAYAPAAPVLRWYGLAILAFVLSVVVLNFELARDRLGYVYVFAAVTVVEIVLLWIADASMVGLVQIILVTNTGLLGYGLVRVKA